MRKAALLYNPASGGGKRRKRELEAAAELLRSHGVEVEFDLTRSSSEAAQQAKQASSRGCDTILACGGDGTIHDVVQGIAETDATLGILPLGTANALAHDLGLPMRPVAAAQAALNAVPLKIALGKIAYSTLRGEPASRYFIVAAGIGVDAHLFYKLNAGVKHRLGMTAYYAKAWSMWMSHRMVRFDARWKNGHGDRSASLTELLAVRITNFGGVLRELAPGASLGRDDFSVVMCSTESRSAYLNYVARAVLGVSRTVRGVDIVQCSEMRCSYESDRTPDSKARVFVEADGELLGTLPANISVVSNALALLVPREVATRMTANRV